MNKIDYEREVIKYIIIFTRYNILIHGCQMATTLLWPQGISGITLHFTSSAAVHSSTYSG
jgi:hypothetical protein